MKEKRNEGGARREQERPRKWVGEREKFLTSVGFMGKRAQVI